MPEPGAGARKLLTLLLPQRRRPTPSPPPMLAPLTSIDELNDALSLPVVVLFKHSPVCAVSSMAMREMFRLVAERPDIPVHMLDIRAHRALSAELAERLGIRHESPQVMLLRHGELAWHGSHFQVTAARVERAVDELDVDAPGADVQVGDR